MILLTGATGYVGGRLLRALERADRPVRCLVRRPESLQGHAADSTEIIAGDVLDSDSLRHAMRGIEVAYYLVHSMAGAADFEQRDRLAAERFAQAARDAGVRRLIYLGELGHGAGLSHHLASRQEVGRILRESGVPTIEFRASIIIGSGSLSFEMIRTLVTRLPAMTTPRWVRMQAQPIAIEDVIEYLVAAADCPLAGSTVYEIGGPDRASYLDLMKEFARQRGLRRLIVPVPVLTPRLSSLWLRLVTPLYASVGRQLIDSIRNETVVRDDRALHDFTVRPRGFREAIARALANEDRQFAETRWCDALSASERPGRYGGEKLGPRLVDSRSVWVPCPPAVAFGPVRRIGGETGWYYGNRLWRIRGFLDTLIGGVGLRRGRRDPEWVGPGGTIDFWRVEAVEPDRLLRLRAEMRVPGRAWLQFEVEPDRGGSVIRQTALFDPSGLAGLAYWYSLYPLHGLVFAGMLEGIARACRTGDRATISSMAIDSDDCSPRMSEGPPGGA
jgi:uncharacterized protein YbjT (DUF2867 family)